MKKLNPENQINITNDTLTQILSAYDILDFTSSSIHEGISNTSFVIESGNKKYVLRIYAQNRKKQDDILFEIGFQDYLRENGIPIPLIYKDTQGSELTILENDDKRWQCILMEFVEGQSVTVHPSREVISELAKLQAKIHWFGVDFVDKTDRPKELWPDLHDSIAVQLEDIPVKTQEVLRFIERVKNYRYILNTNLTYGYNHLDIDFDGNVLVKDNKVNGIVDFDDLKYSPTVVCLGFSLWNILDDEGQDAMNYYLNEYEKIRPLSSLEKEALPHIIFFRNYVIGIIRLMLWENDTPIEDIEGILKLEKQIPLLKFN